jgi:hypothetical protein
MRPQSHWNEIRRFCWKHFASDWKRANHYLRKTDRFYSRLIAEVEKKPGHHDEAANLYSEWHTVREPEQYEVDRLLTLYYLRRAARHHLPQPDDYDSRYWQKDEFRGVSRLTDAGIDFIDRALYERRKRRLEIWVPLIAALAGVVAAAAGLAAILLSHR